MRIRYRCTNKPWHLTHEFDIDENTVNIDKPVKCLFCGSDMDVEIIKWSNKVKIPL